MKTHNLKIWPEYLEQVKSGIKTFEVRKNDRDFKVGDSLILRAFDPDKAIQLMSTAGGYTGDWIEVDITYIFEDYVGNLLKSDVVVLGVKVKA